MTLLLVFNLWYPAPLHEAVGVTQIFLLILMVDVTIGPVLTLIVARQGKKSLVFDLALIVALQLSALGYGVWTVAEGRPAWLVFNMDRVDLVRAFEVDTRHISSARPEYQATSWFGPQWVAARNPEDADERNELLFESIFSGVDLPHRPEYYLPLSEVKLELIARASPLEMLERYNTPASVAAEMRRWPRADAWLPMMSVARPMTVLIRKDTAEVVAIVALHPWEELEAD